MYNNLIFLSNPVNGAQLLMQLTLWTFSVNSIRSGYKAGDAINNVKTNNISQKSCKFAALNNKTKQDMKTKNEILHLLSLYKPTAQSKYGLTRLGIFGSVARDEHTEGSDVDVCYEGRVPTLLTLDLIQTDLEKLLESRVDLVRVRDGMNSLLKQRIQKEGVYV